MSTHTSETEPQPNILRNRAARAAGAVGLAALTLVGCGFKPDTIHASPSPDISVSTSISPSPAESSTAPEPSETTPSSLAEFQNAIGEYCDQETVARAANIYETTLAPGSTETQNPTDLVEQAKIALERLAKARAEAQTVELPHKLTELLETGSKEHISEIQDLLVEYFAQLGIKAIFEWQSSDNEAPAFGAQLTDSQLQSWNTYYALKGIAQSTELLTRDLLQAAQVERIYFADLAKDPVLKETGKNTSKAISLLNNTIILNVPTFEGEQQALVTSVHELVHQVAFRDPRLKQCLEDGIAQLNPAEFEGYGPAAVTQVLNGVNGIGSLSEMVRNPSATYDHIAFSEPGAAGDKAEDAHNLLERYLTADQSLIEQILKGNPVLDPLLRKSAVTLAALPQQLRELIIARLETAKVSEQISATLARGSSDAGLTEIITRLQATNT